MNKKTAHGEQAQPVEDSLLSYQQAAEILGIGPAAMRQWVDEKKLRVAKFNARVHRLFASDIQRLREEAVAA